MDATAIAAIFAGVAGVVAAYFQGKKTTLSGAVTTATEVVTLLEARVSILEDQIQSKDTVIADLTTRVEILQDLVTQRADVDTVKGVVLRIAEKVGA